ncbi:MAG: hypothetical protein KGN84_02175 [Acidobacteriota bacterium]|nr:hypothetical protein [Acidobacteriota bacterium]
MSQAQARPRPAAVIALPVFDDHRLLIVDWFERIERNSVRRVIPEMEATCGELRRVRKSIRHARLAEFLEQTLIALRAGEREGAKYILLTALATFGWPSDLMEA